MDKNESNILSEKIALAVEFANQNPDARELALYLANCFQSEIVGLFVEGEDLLLSAQFPFSREIVASSANERIMDMTNMQRTLRAWSTHMQQELLAQATKEKIKCSFHQLNRSQSRYLLNQVKDFQILIFSGLRRLNYPLKRISHTVCVFVDDNSHMDSIPALIKQVIPRDINHILFIDSGDNESKTRIRSTIRELSPEKRIGNPHFQIQKFKNDGEFDLELFATLRTITRQHPISFVIIPGGHHLIAQPAAFKSLQQELSCPIVIAG